MGLVSKVMESVREFAPHKIGRLAVLMAALAYTAACTVPQISSGRVVNRYKGYERGDAHISSNVNDPPTYGQPIAIYRVKIEGEVNGETVSRWFNVSETEFRRINIGDHYRP